MGYLHSLLGDKENPKFFYKFLSIIFIQFSLTSFAGDQTRTPHDHKVLWDSSTIGVALFPELTDISTLDSLSIMNNSLAEWQNQISIPLQTNDLSKNFIKASNDKRFFGPGVLGVTYLSYSARQGKIESAGIYLNQTTYGVDRFFRFTSDQSLTNGQNFYLGDIVSHELGHLFGLSHSETFDSSMYFAAFRGQHSLGQDDISTLRGIYQPQLYKSVRGTVLGGRSVPIFGAHIQLVNVETMKVEAGTFSEDDGTFEINGLASGQYYIFISPMFTKEKNQLRYLTVVDNFCPQSYVGEFVQGCPTSQQGIPRVVNIGESNINLNNVSIRCSSKISFDYLQQKIESQSSSTDLNEVDSLLPRRGFFRQEDVTQSLFDDAVYDEYLFDLTNYANTQNSYFELFLMSEIFSTMASWKIEASGSFGTITRTATTTTHGKLNSDIKLTYPLSAQNELNLISVKIYPRQLSLIEKVLTFPSSNDLPEGEFSYLIRPGIREGIQAPIMTSSHQYLSDERNCLDAPLAYNTKRYQNAAQIQSDNNSAADEIEQQSQKAPLSCGTIGDDGGSGGGGLLQGILAFILTFIFLSFFRTKDKILLP